MAEGKQVGSFISRNIRVVGLARARLRLVGYESLGQKEGIAQKVVIDVIVDELP